MKHHSWLSCNFSSEAIQLLSMPLEESYPRRQTSIVSEFLCLKSSVAEETQTLLYHQKCSISLNM